VATKEGGRVKGRGGQRRLIYTEYDAAYEAKNRMGLPSEIDMQWQVDEPAIVNVGSVGQPRDGDPRSSFVTYDGDGTNGTVRFYRTESDVAATMAKIRDIEELPVHSVIANAVGQGERQNRWRRWYVPSEEWEWPDEPVGLLCIDGYHTYSQVQTELDRFADRVTGTLVFHDTMSCGIKGDGIANRSIHSSKMMDDEKGIRLAIDHLMMRDPSWRIASHVPYASGLLVLRRAPQ